ncbi:MAG: hypothetical protein QOF76_3799 [Solirubrobacteraceae bacterium]|jgi:peptidoglycan hydrolase CwlO-like protein|nr:hypothetical protein [Solirubrobacteraceae bacterium]
MDTVGPAVGRARLIIACACLALLAAGSVVAGAQSEGSLRSQIGSSKSRESALSGAVARLQALESDAEHDVAAMQTRVNLVQSSLEIAIARRDQTGADLRAEQAHAAELARRLADARTQLAALLLERYENGTPTLIDVVLSADGFSGLLETAHFVRRVQHADAQILGNVREARAESVAEKLRLALLAQRQAADVQSVGRQRDALSGILGSLQQRQSQLEAARAARQQALSSAVADRQSAQRTLDKLIKARQAAARAVYTAPTSNGSSSGPWGIPAAIVMCESGGQNLSPNAAGASGYYQFLPSTWAGLGGSTPAAYQATKAEQDRLAAKLWAGGAGAHNWVCASLV